MKFIIYKDNSYVELYYFINELPIVANVKVKISTNNLNITQNFSKKEILFITKKYIRKHILYNI